MNEEQFEREKYYHIATAISNMLLTQGIFSEEDVNRIDKLLISKYQPLIGALHEKNPRGSPKDKTIIM